MKLSRLLLLIAVLAVACATVSAGSDSGGLLKFPNVNTKGFTQYTDFQMFQGWWNNQLIWYIATDASDQQIACSTKPKGEFWNGLNYAPRLVEMTDEGEAAILYVITNLNQGPVFTAVPEGPNYSGIWQVVYVTFNKGVMKHQVTNADPFDPVTNPTGLPSMSDATFTSTNKAGLPIVVKYPIMAIGPLGGPWTPAIPGEYRIPQGKVMPDYARTKIIFLPFWQEYCRNPISKKITVQRFIVPDVFDPPGLPFEDQLAPKLGANIAPALGLTDDTDGQAFFWLQGVQPLSQFPIVEACPVPMSLWSMIYGDPCKNFNQDYTPVQFVVVLQRNFPLLPASTIINNEPLLIDLLFNGRLSIIRDTQVIDAPILPEELPHA